MSRLRRAVLTACILGLGPALGGCESFDIDKITSMFDNKKPLPGDRKPLFPQGVPGVPQGVPPDLVTHNSSVAVIILRSEALREARNHRRQTIDLGGEFLNGFDELPRVRRVDAQEASVHDMHHLRVRFLQLLGNGAGRPVASRPQGVVADADVPKP